MCNPIALAVASFAMTGAQAVQQQGAAENQADMINQQYEQNYDNSIAEMQDSYRQTSARQMQEQDAAGEQKRQRQMQERQELASANVAAGEAGVTGYSVEALLRNISSLSLQDQTNINQGRDMRISQLTEQQEGIRSQTTARINGAQQARSPSKWAMGLSIGAGALNAAGNYYNQTKVQGTK